MALYGRPAELPPPASWHDNSGSPCLPTTSSQDFSTVESVDQFVPGPEEYSAAVFPFPPLDDNNYATKQPNIIFDVCQEDIWTSSPTDITSEPFVPHIPQPSFHRRKCPSSTISASTSISSSAASTWSSVQTDDDCQTIVPISSSSRLPSPSAPITLPQRMVCLGPQCSEAFTSDADLEAHVRAAHTYTCKWVGCSHPSFASREGLVWHVESEHLLICPCRGCDESGFEDPRVLMNHIAVGHPEVAKDGIKQWQLSTQVTAQSTEAIQRPSTSTKSAHEPVETTSAHLGKRKNMADDQERQAISNAKRKFQEQLRTAINKRARRASNQPSTLQPSTEDRSSPRGKFACRACSDKRSFAKFEALTRHYRVVHPEYSMPQASRPRGAVVTSPSSFFPTPVSVTSTPTYFPISPGTVRTPTSSSGGTLWTTPLSPLQESLSRSATINDKPVPFPLIFEHAILPFLVAFLPRWTGPRHVVSVTRGRTPQARRICITTPEPISRARKILIAKHLHDLLSLPESQHHRSSISFLFPVGTVDRTYGTSCWARGISRENMDDVCVPRNPFYFSSPCMGDSIGISATEEFDESTATLGPCLSVDGGNYWLANFHPFVDAYQSADPIVVEHPSAQDRAMCVSEAHDAVASKSTFQIGNVQVTSGLTLKTTRISHDPYWEDYGMDPPLVVTDWALIDARSSHANILRRFPIDYPHRTAPEPEPLVRETSAIVPGAPVVSSGRTSGYGTGQICEIPAYVSGAENGVQKATREWFIEESYASDDEEEWIRGGIGVHGDSGAAVVDAETGCLVGQLWGRNKYWGPGPRHTFFTPIADIFDDIQEKCGQQTRPQLPQYRSEGDCYPIEPPCRTCYDTYRNLDSRRSSRLSLQSMVIATGEMGEQDGATSIEAASELATPRPLDRNPNAGLEEIGMTFGTVLWSAPTPSRASQGIASPGFNDMRSPYAQTLELDDLQERDHSTSDPLRKRASYNAFGLSPRASSQPSKRPRLVE